MAMYSQRTGKFCNFYIDTRKMIIFCTHCTAISVLKFCIKIRAVNRHNQHDPKEHLVSLLRCMRVYMAQATDTLTDTKNAEN